MGVTGFGFLRGQELFFSGVVSIETFDQWVEPYLFVKFQKNWAKTIFHNVGSFQAIVDKDSKEFSLDLIFDIRNVKLDFVKRVSKRLPTYAVSRTCTKRYIGKRMPINTIVW